MTDAPFLHLYSRDPARNRARFYALSVERDLFGDWCLIRRWGRIGQGGRMRAERFADRRGAEAAQARATRARLRRGYEAHQAAHQTAYQTAHQTDCQRREAG